MKHLIFCLCVLSFSISARASETAHSAVNALKTYCLPAIEKNISPADFASSIGLPEISSDAAPAYADSGARVFAIPPSNGNMILIADPGMKPICSLAITKIDTMRFWQEIDSAFPSTSRFMLIREKRAETQKLTRRDYQADINGLVTLLISASDNIRPGGIQALMTIARHK